MVKPLFTIEHMTNAEGYCYSLQVVQVYLNCNDSYARSIKINNWFDLPPPPPIESIHIEMRCSSSIESNSEL